MNTKIIRCWSYRNWFLPRTTWQSKKVFPIKLTSSSRVVEKKDHKVEVLQVNKIGGFCSSSERRSYGVQERNFTRNFFDKRYNQLSHV